MFELSAGQIVADKYRVDAVVGTGGMGVVVAARHLDLDQRVAIKFLREASHEALARFQREARMLVRLKSPHIARVIDVGALDDDTPFIVMELLEGEDLGALLRARGRLPVEEAVDYVLQATCAVAEAHSLGMVHRDLKPANLFLAKGPGGTRIVKVLDFGVSKILDDRNPGELTRGGDLTNEGVALGSPGYMSPEQMTSSRDVDARTDVFSLGAILYRLVSGEVPYKGSSVVSVLASMAIEPLRPLRELVPVSPDFDAIVERCLLQDRELRWPTVAHFAEALAPFASRRGRQSVDQIIATMNVPMQGPSSGQPGPSGEASFGATVIRPFSMPAPVLPSAGGTLPLGSAYPSGPSSLAAHGGNLRHIVIAGCAAVATFAVGAALVAARTPRGPEGDPANEPTLPVPIPVELDAGAPNVAPTGDPATAPPPTVMVPPQLSTATIEDPVTPPAATAPTTPTTPTTEARPPQPRPTFTAQPRPKPHGTQGHTTSNPNSTPPTPAEVPSSRH